MKNVIFKVITFFFVVSLVISIGNTTFAADEDFPTVCIAPIIWLKNNSE